jgi:hypothetical protein
MMLTKLMLTLAIKNIAAAVRVIARSQRTPMTIRSSTAESLVAFANALTLQKVKSLRSSNEDAADHWVCCREVRFAASATISKASCSAGFGRDTSSPTLAMVCISFA